MTTSTIALVTGANKGIGRQIAAGLAERGLTVLLGSRDRARGAAAVAGLAGSGDVRLLVLDVTDPASIAAAAAQIGQQHGRLDVLVNNAGISEGLAQPPSATSLDAVRRVFETNVFGVIATSNAMLPLLRRSPAGRIVNVSSALGSLTLGSDPDGPLRDIPPVLGYIPSKTALNAVTVQYAKELRDTGILVNAADPGYVATDLNGHSGFLTPAEGARITIRLATLTPDGPTGGLFNEQGPVPW